MKAESSLDELSIRRRRAIRGTLKKSWRECFHFPAVQNIVWSLRSYDRYAKANCEYIADFAAKTNAKTAEPWASILFRHSRYRMDGPSPDALPAWRSHAGLCGKGSQFTERGAGDRNSGVS